jgi:mono/diheme cytochrome c family protein
MEASLRIARSLVTLAWFAARVGLLCPLLLRADPASTMHKPTPDEARGKIIYATGQSPAGGPISYRLLSAGATVFPARGVFCANCHGVDGRGGKKGDAFAPDITHDILSRPLETSGPLGRQRPAYTQALLARAITQGLDSSGELLSPMMPRWVLSESELQDLLQYLEHLGSQ